MPEWTNILKLVEGKQCTPVEAEKLWKTAKSKFDHDFDGVLSRAEIALYLANTHVRAFYFVRREEIMKD
jgi:hypothetical protein